MMPVLGRDCSNYTRMPLALDDWKAAGVGWVCIQAINPPPAYPATKTVAQIDACLAAGLAVDVYVWLWFDLDAADIAAKLALLSGYTDGRQIRQVWLDVEDVAAAKYDQPTTEAKVAAALALCDAFPTSSGTKTGVYSGKWFWADGRYMANSAAFSDRKLWDAHYDQVADAAVGFAPYGGWPSCAVKQHGGSQPDGTDIDVLSEAEAATLTQASPPSAPASDPAPTPATPDRETPGDYPFADWRQSAIAYRGALDTMGKELADAQAKVAATATPPDTASAALVAQLKQTATDRDAAVAARNSAQAKLDKVRAALA